jgi:hypothetical protein
MGNKSSRSGDVAPLFCSTTIAPPPSVINADINTTSIAAMMGRLMPASITLDVSPLVSPSPLNMSPPTINDGDDDIRHYWYQQLLWRLGLRVTPLPTALTPASMALLPPLDAQRGTNDHRSWCPARINYPFHSSTIDQPYYDKHIFQWSELQHGGQIAETERAPQARDATGDDLGIYYLDNHVPITRGDDSHTTYQISPNGRWILWYVLRASLLSLILLCPYAIPVLMIVVEYMRVYRSHEHKRYIRHGFADHIILMCSWVTPVSYDSNLLLFGKQPSSSSANAATDTRILTPSQLAASSHRCVASFGDAKQLADAHTRMVHRAQYIPADPSSSSSSVVPPSASSSTINAPPKPIPLTVSHSTAIRGAEVWHHTYMREVNHQPDVWTKEPNGTVTFGYLSIEWLSYAPATLRTTHEKLKNGRVVGSGIKQEKVYEYWHCPSRDQDKDAWCNAIATPLPVLPQPLIQLICKYFDLGYFDLLGIIYLLSSFIH